MTEKKETELLQTKILMKKKNEEIEGAKKTISQLVSQITNLQEEVSQCDELPILGVLDAYSLLRQKFNEKTLSIQATPLLKGAQTTMNFIQVDDFISKLSKELSSLEPIYLEFKKTISRFENCVISFKKSHEEKKQRELKLFEEEAESCVDFISNNQ